MAYSCHAPESTMGHGALRCISRLSPGEILHQTLSVVVDLMGAVTALAARSCMGKNQSRALSRSVIGSSRIRHWRGTMRTERASAARRADATTVRRITW